MGTTETTLKKIHETLDNMNKNITCITEKLDIRLSELKSESNKNLTNTKVSKWIKSLKEK